MRAGDFGAGGWIKGFWLAAVLAAPGFDSFTQGECGDTEGNDGIEPPPAQQHVGQQASEGTPAARYAHSRF